MSTRPNRATRRAAGAEPGSADRGMGGQARRRVAAGVMAATAVATVGAGQVMGQGQAQAGLFDFLLPTNIQGSVDAVSNINGDQAVALQQLIAQISGGAVDNAATQTLLDQWRIEACGTGGTSSSGQANCSESELAGIAIVLPGSVDLVPRIVYVNIQGAVNSQIVQGLLNVLGIQNATLPNAAEPVGSATVKGDGFQFAVASTGGRAQAISYLPVSLATAGASGGRTAVAFAVVGMANAWTTDDVPVDILGIDTGLGIPGLSTVSCYGGITGAYADGVGACANIAGISDFRLDLRQNLPEVQFAATDPSAILLDPASVFGQVITQLLNGQPLNLSKDFVRFTVGGDRTNSNGMPILFTLTSDYGTQDPITIRWLGSTITLNPEVEVNGVMKPNHLGAPIFTFGTPTGAADLVPVIDIPEIVFPFGIPTAGPYTVGATAAAAPTPASATTMSARSFSAIDDSTGGDGAESETSLAPMDVVDSAPSTGPAGGGSIDTSSDDSTSTSEQPDPVDVTPVGGKHQLTETGRHHSGVVGGAGGGKHSAPEAGTGSTSDGSDSSSTSGGSADSTDSTDSSTSAPSSDTTGAGSASSETGSSSEASAAAA